MERYNINIYIESSRRGPSKGPGAYMYLMEFIKSDGTPATREGIEHFSNTYENELSLRAIIAAGKRLIKPCHIRIFTGCNHILSTVHNCWHIEWQKNGWKKKNDKPVRNAELWEELVQVLDAHVVTYTKDEHPYQRYMRERLEKEKQNV